MGDIINQRSKEYYQKNKERIREYSKEYYYKNRETILIKSKKLSKDNKYTRKEYDMKRSYNLDLEGYSKIFDEQEGRCKICNKYYTESQQGLVIDHNHETGEIRGLLCSKCNLALGLINENIHTLQNMIKYLTSGCIIDIYKN